MSRWLYTQVSGGEEAWEPILANDRAQFVAAKSPRFITVLSLSSLVTEATTREEMAQIKYLGPFYVDFDGESIDVVLPKFQQFLGKLKDLEVDLTSLQLFATGGRGFHVLAPLELFLSKVPRQGICFLPAIFKEIAYEVFVDTLDLRVYSARKGRQFRVENSLRENGAYKVPISVEEAFSMTVDEYKVLCSAPRVAPTLTPPLFNQKLSVLYAKAEEKVAAAAKKRKDGTKDLALLARFGGQFPPSLLKIMAGEPSAESKGFQLIAMQIAITANALGKKEEDVLSLCEGLIQNHVSDGARYNSPGKRKAELSRMLRYTADNPCYTYSRDAVRSLLPKGQASTDLDGLPESAGAVMGEESAPEDGGLRGGVFLTEAGIYRRTEDGVQQICDVAFKDPVVLTDAVSGNRIGFEAEVLVAGRSVGHKLVEQQTFLSRAHFQKFAMQNMGGFKGTDNDLVAASTILRDTAMANGGNVYVIGREGLDLIKRPDAGGEEHLDLLWVSPADGEDGVLTDSPLKYKYRGVPTTAGIFKSDLLQAPRLVTGDDHAAEVINSLLNVNVPFVVGTILGWMVSAFHRQIYHHRFKQFPLLSLFGPAGCGKTNTITDFVQLHYHLQEPIIRNADGDTKFALEGALQSSASIPLILDEYKPSEMRAGRHGMLKGMLRSAYNQTTFSKGGMSSDLNSSWRDIRSMAYSAPVVYMSEGLESETAMLHRTLAVAMRHSYLVGRREHHRALQENRSVISSLGSDIVYSTFKWKPEAFFETVNANMRVARQTAGENALDRPVFNLAVVMTGLDFLSSVLNVRFGDRFNDQIVSLKTAANDSSLQISTQAMPEAAKALNALSLISHTEDPMSEYGLRIGIDYVIDGDCLDLAVRNCYVKLAGWSRRKDQKLHFDNEEMFMHGLANFGPLRSKAALTSVLKQVSGREMAKVYRFSIKALTEEGVESFRPT